MYGITIRAYVNDIRITDDTLHTLFPKARAAVIRLLFTDGGKRYHLRELARRSGLAVRSIQTELALLLGSELLLEERDGNRRYFSANSDHALFPELQGIARKAVSHRLTLVEALNSVDGVELAFIFGPLASGSAREDSAIDLMVVGSISERRLMSRLEPIEQLAHRNLNLHLYTAERFRALVRNRGPFMSSILEGPKIWLVGELPASVA